LARAALVEEIRTIFAENRGRYGAPRMHACLRAHGRLVGRHRIARLMRRADLRGLAAIPRRVRTTDSRHGHPIARNRLRRNFTATAPNQVRLADLTYVRTGEGWRSRGLRGPAGATVPAHLAALIDMHTRKVAGWAGRDTLHADIALEALEMAIKRQRPTPGLVPRLASVPPSQPPFEKRCDDRLRPPGMPRTPTARSLPPQGSRRR